MRNASKFLGSLMLAAALAAGCVDDTAPTTTGTKPKTTTHPAATPTPSPGDAVLPKTPAKPIGQVLGLDGQPAVGVLVRATGATQLTQVVRVPVVANNGGSLVSNNGGAYSLMATGLETKTDAQGYFGFEVGDQVLNIEAVQADDVKALKLAVSGGTHDLVMQLAYTGSLTGKVTAKNVTNLEGVDVYVPGTSYTAKTDANGQFTISNVPAGTFDVAATKAGLGEGRATGVKVESKAAAQVPTIDLSSVVPNITKMDPVNGGPGTKVTLTGGPFGAATGTPFQVTFNGVPVAAPKRLDDKTIEAIVPNGVSNGDVLVTLAGTNGNPVPFKVIKTMTISPRPSKLVLGTTQAFTATVLDTDGKPVINPAVTWTAENATFKDGTLTADKVGKVKLTVTAGTVTDSVSFDVASTVPGVVTLVPDQHFQEPIALVGDADGNIIFCDNAAQSIQRITPDGKVTTIAGGHPGYADGAGASAAFANPNGIALGIDGTMYVTEWEGCRVRKITKDGVVSTLAGSKNWPDDHHGYKEGVDARFDNPKGCAVDTAGNVYVADWSNHVIRQITPAGVTTTYAGTGTAGDLDGQADAAQFTNPAGVAIGPDGSLLVTDAGTGKLKKVSRDRKVTTIASGLSKPLGVSLGTGNVYYVAEAGKNRIIMIGQDGTVTLLAGGGEVGFADGLEADAKFNEPNDVSLINGFLAVADRLNHKVRKLTF